MRVLDLDMDYFMKSVATFINESEPERLPEEDYGDSVWSEREVRNFLEGNLGLSKQNRIRGRVVAGHNESLFFWRELIEKGDLSTPFDVIHVDSHADLGLGYSSWTHICSSNGSGCLACMTISTGRSIASSAISPLALC